MEGIQSGQNVSNIQFQGRTNPRAAYTTEPVYEQKKDGTKKLLLALGGLATIGAGIYLVKSGKAGKAVDKIKNTFSGDKAAKAAKKTADNAADDIAKGVKPSKVASGADSDIAKKISSMSADDAAGAVSKQKDKIQKLATEINENQTQIKQIEGTISDHNKQIEQLRENMKKMTKSGQIENANNQIKHYEKLISEENTKLAELQNNAAELTHNKDVCEGLITNLKTYNNGAQETIDAQRLAKRRAAHGLS